MAIHFRADDDQLRPLGRATRGVRAMSLKGDDELVGMDILTGQLVESLVSSVDDDSSDDTVLRTPVSVLASGTSNEEDKNESCKILMFVIYVFSLS